MALAASLLAVVPLAVVPPEAAAQTAATGAPYLHRTSIVEGQQRFFEISNVPDASAHYLRIKPLSAPYTAESGDLSATTDQRSITPGGNGAQTRIRPASQRIRFELEARADNDTDDETFGLQLCSSAACTGAGLLAEWDIAIADASDATLTGTGGGGVTVSGGGGGASMMERTANNDPRDHRDTITVSLDSPPTGPIVIVAGVADAVPNADGTPTSIASATGSFAKHELPSPTAAREVLTITQQWLDLLDTDGTPGVSQAEWDAAEGAWRPDPHSFEVSLRAFDNAVDTPGGVLSGTLKLTVYDYDSKYFDEADRTVTVGGRQRTVKGPDTATAPTEYTGITLPDVALAVTDDDEPTRIRLLPADGEDSTATEASATDTAKFRVVIDRALTAKETVTVPLAFSGAALGTNFSVALDGSPTGAAYADSDDGTQGRLTLSGAGAQRATLAVTALTDSDTVSETLEASIPRRSDTGPAPYFTSSLAGGLCAGQGCAGHSSVGYDSTEGEQRSYRMTLIDQTAAAGLAVLDVGDGRLLEGGRYLYSVRLTAQPTGDVTVTAASADPSKAIVTAGASLTFGPQYYPSWRHRQYVIVSGVQNADDAADALVGITHTLSGPGAYAGVAPVTHTLTLVDDDATTVTMAGSGVRTVGDADSISRVMVEGEPEAVDSSLTVSLSRPLADGEFVRVPLYLEAKGHTRPGAAQECVLDDDGNGNTVEASDGTSCDVVQSVRGPRVSANVAYPPRLNDFQMTASGVGVSVEAVDRLTPSHVGYRYLEFRGAGAQSAVIEMHATDGFDDGDAHHEEFRIAFPSDFRALNPNHPEYTGRWLPPVTNLDGGIEAWVPGAQAWFAITDDESPDQADVVEVPPDWPLLPSGLEPGDRFRLLYVTNATTAASTGGSSGRTAYTDFVRAEITGAGLKQGGVAHLKPYANRIHPVITIDRGGAAYINARFDPNDASHPDDPIYWVGGNKAADDKADFTDGSWDDEASPTYADGTAAAIAAGGYWTGSKSHGHRRTGANCPDGGDHLNAGKPSVNVGYLNSDNSALTPLGPTTDTCDHGEPAAEQRPMYALSGTFSVGSAGARVADAAAAEGSAVTFTVTIPAAAPQGGITVPYTLADGRARAADPDYLTATGASGGAGADYDSDAGSVTIAEGATSADFAVATTDDGVYESDH